MCQYVRRMIILGLCIVMVLFIASPVQTEESMEGKVKLTGAEIEELFLKSGTVTFGLVPSLKLVWLGVVGNFGRELFGLNWEDPDVWGMDVSGDQIAGDQLCEQVMFRRRCLDIYRVGQDKYETWLEGKLWSTMYVCQISPSSGAEKEDKVKWSEAELKEYMSPSVIVAGFTPATRTVWIVINQENGNRYCYWRSLRKAGLTATAKGTHRIDGDKVCQNWPWESEHCIEFYWIGEDKYETRYLGNVEHICYRLK